MSAAYNADETSAHDANAHAKNLEHEAVQEHKLEAQGLLRKDRHPADGRSLKPQVKKGGQGAGNWGGVEDEIAEGKADFEQGRNIAPHEPEPKLTTDA